MCPSGFRTNPASGVSLLILAYGMASSYQTKPPLPSWGRAEAGGVKAREPRSCVPPPQPSPTRGERKDPQPSPIRREEVEKTTWRLTQPRSPVLFQLTTNIFHCH